MMGEEEAGPLEGARAVIQQCRLDAGTLCAKLKIEMQAAKAAEDIWERTGEYFDKKWHAHLADHLEKHLAQISALEESAARVMTKVREQAKLEARTAMNKFPMRFEVGCTEAGIDIDLATRHPRYRVCKSFIQVEVLEASLEVKISNREALVTKIPCDLPALIARIQSDNKRLFERKFLGPEFLAGIARDYDEIQKDESSVTESGVQLREIMRRRGKNTKGFRSDEFLVDLSECVREGVLEHEGRRLDLQQTKDRQAGMLLVGQEVLGLVGSIVFRKVG